MSHLDVDVIDLMEIDRLLNRLWVRGTCSSETMNKVKDILKTSCSGKGHKVW